MKEFIICFLFLALGLSNALCQNVINFFDDTEEKKIGKSVYIFEDKENLLDFRDILSKEELFKPNTSDGLSLGLSSSVFWIKFTICNESNIPYLVLELDQPSLNRVTLYKVEEENEFTVEDIGEHQGFGSRIYDHPVYLFDLLIAKNETHTYYLKIKSDEPISLPIAIKTHQFVTKHLSNKDLMMGIYLGVMFIMILYNFFVYTSVKDRNYLYYILYLSCVCLVQASIQGYTSKFLWPDSCFLMRHSIFIFAPLSTITAILFVNQFLQTKVHTKRIYLLLNIMSGLFLLAIILSFFNQFQLAYQVINITTLMTSVLVLIVAIKSYQKRVYSAKFFLIGWLALIIGGAVYALKEMGLLDQNFYTQYSIQLGSVIEAVLLSFALADKINTYKKERLVAIQEKEQLLVEQNIKLEDQVNIRTQEVAHKNEALRATIIELKSTQNQLVHSEKMASLGQLTAGIAHEINNPMNYVLQSADTLGENFDDLKGLISEYEKAEGFNNAEEIAEFKENIDLPVIYEELDECLADIREGVIRTIEISDGLRVFSRLDEASFKTVDLVENLKATVKLMRQEFSLKNINLEEEYGPSLEIACNSGKLNQVFMNILNNAIYAIEKKENASEPGVISIKVNHVNDELHLEFTDNGIGMSEETVQKMFDPFFTTKDVGEGTGLGMSITHGIINEHKGSISVTSIPNKGTTFKIRLPVSKIREEEEEEEEEEE